jgi:predicted ATPase/class 3 adenylate cyclase
VGLPTGTVTFCMTDIEGSTRLLADLGPEYARLLLDHHAIVRGELARHSGVEVSTEGDSFFLVFRSAVDAVRTAVGVQRCLAAHAWPGGHNVRVRIGIHTGEGTTAGDGYVGMDVHRVARVSAAGHGGQVLLTAATEALLEEHWPEGTSAVPLGVHRLKDLPAPETLYQLVADGLTTRFAPLRSLEAPAYELPTAPTPILGRDDDAARVAQLLAGHRLVTLTGPGGVGKTRLALHLAELLRDDFPDGVAFVPLAEVRDPELVPDEIARALALPTASYSGAAGIARLADHLRDRRALLILDNVEQLGEGAEVIARLLHAAPGPRVLATSRGPLRLREEQRYPVEALAPDAAVAEFVERARAVRPDLRLGRAEEDAVARIVDGVGRLPLAVELAASRVGTLGLAEIADRLGSQLGLLRSGPRDLPHRQQTLRSTLVWSYELLDEPARRTFAAFAVFPGGATLEALEQVVPPSPAGADLLETVEALVDQGLVRPGADGADRFTTLQVVRELAGELLEAGGAGAQVWRRAAERLAALAGRAGPRLVTAERADWLDRLQAEHDNLRAALSWATEDDPVLAADIAAPIWRYWQMRGYLREGRAVLDAIRERLDADDLRARYAVLAALGGIAYWQRDLPAGETACVEAVRVAEQLDDPAALAEALYNLSFPTWQQGRMADAAALADRSQQLFDELGDTDGTARTLWLHGILAVMTGDLHSAEKLLAESVERHRGSPAAFHLGWSLRMLGRTLLLQGRPAEARERVEESLRLFAPAGDVSAILLHLSDFATIAALEGDDERTLRLAGALEHLKNLTGTDLVDHPVNAIPSLADTVARHGADGERLLAEGAAMSLAEVVRYALREPGMTSPRTT